MPLSISEKTVKGQVKSILSKLGANGTAGVIAIASMSLANPDLVERIRTNAPLNTPDPSTFYGGATKGYTDYPTLAMTAHREGRGET